MNKKVLLALAFCFFFAGAFADSITGLTISGEAPLGENVSVRGQYVADSNAYELCKFEVKDSVGNYIERWSDEKTFDDGTFYAERKLVEPPYYRGNDYNVLVTCGTATSEGTFRVDHKKDLLGFKPSGFIAEIDWLTNPENSLSVTFFFFSILFIATVVVIFGKNFL